MNAEQQALGIESKRKLLAFLRTNPQGMTMESYLCLTRILTAADGIMIKGFGARASGG